MNLEEVMEIAENWIQPGTEVEERKKWWFLGGLPNEVATFIRLKVGKPRCVDIWRRIYNVTMNLAKNIWMARCDKNKGKGWLFTTLWKDHIDRLVEEENVNTIIDVTQHPEWFCTQ